MTCITNIILLTQNASLGVSFFLFFSFMMIFMDYMKILVSLSTTCNFSFPQKENMTEIKTLQIGGGKAPSWDEKPSADIYTSISGDRHGENDWVDLESDLYHWTKSLRPVQV